MFYDVLDISATPMKCSCPFPFPETNVLIFENVQMIMFDEELKGKVTGMCEVLILVQSVCKSQRTLSHPPTPPHPTPPRNTWCEQTVWATSERFSEPHVRPLPIDYSRIGIVALDRSQEFFGQCMRKWRAVGQSPLFPLLRWNGGEPDERMKSNKMKNTMHFGRIHPKN